MDKPWKNYLPALCGAIGTVLLAGTAWACLSLERGGPPDRIAVAVALLLLAALALALLRWEGCGRDTLLILLLPIGAAMLFRALSLDYAGTDYKNFLTHWYAYFQEHGGFQAVSHAVGDYNVPYLYFMAFISYLSAPDLYLIKLFSIIFDVILAWGCYRLVRSLTRERQGSAAPLVAFAAARRLKTNEYVAAFIMLALCSGAVTGVEGLSLFGIGLMTVKYTSNIVPALLMVPVMAMLDKVIVTYSPNAIKAIIRPFVLAMVMFPLTLLALGPIGTLIGTALANFCVWMTSFGGLSMAVLSALHPVLVMVGMHTIITPLIVNEIAAVGSSLLFSKALAANLAIAGSALAVGVKAKKAENKQAGISTGITAALSVTEPAVYGCLLRLKKPFVSAIIASAITGIFIGIFDIRAFATASCSFLTLPIFMGGAMSNFYLACAAAVIATVLGFIVTWLIGFDED